MNSQAVVCRYYDLDVSNYSVYATNYYSIRPTAYGVFTVRRTRNFMRIAEVEISIMTHLIRQKQRFRHR